MNGAGWFLFDAAGRKPDPRLRLFCFHYAGGGASIFQAWTKALPADVELVAVQLPGREDRLGEPPLESMDAVIAPLADAIVPLLDRPFAFFGHSTGALVSFQLARTLRQLTLPQPQLLIVSAQDAPQVRPEVIRHTLPDAEFIEVLRRGNGIPDAILQSAALLEILLPRIRADGAVYETYRYEKQAPLDCRIVVFHGMTDRMVERRNLAGWTSETRQRVGCHGFPGGHFFLHEDEAMVLERINHELHALLSEADRVRIG